jgi:Mg-chelatase subunit ChlD
LFFGTQPELPEGLEAVSAIAQNQRMEDGLRELYFERLMAERDSLDPKLDAALVRLVMERARRVVAHPSRPVVLQTQSYSMRPDGELDIEASLEENFSLSNVDDLRVEVQTERSRPCVLMLDCSSSMSGDKHLTASIAVAVLLLRLAVRDAGLVVFHSASKIIKPLLSEETAEQTVLDFLRFQPKGFTNINLGLETGLKQLRSRGAKRMIGLLASDGRSTQGGDPLKAARQFDCLVVLHLHGPGSYLEASQKMASEGGGVCLEVEDFEALPRKMYEALRIISSR